MTKIDKKQAILNFYLTFAKRSLCFIQHERITLRSNAPANRNLHRLYGNNVHDDANDDAALAKALVFELSHGPLKPLQSFASSGGFFL